MYLTFLFLSYLTHCRELLYGVDHLCVDTHFRSYKDEEGYVPMALLSSYPNISCYSASIQDLVEKLSQKEDSILEVDVANETVRLRDGWEKVHIHIYSCFLILPILDHIFCPPSIPP